jgi:hypothetical protein
MALDRHQRYELCNIIQKKCEEARDRIQLELKIVSESDLTMVAWERTKAKYKLHDWPFERLDKLWNANVSYSKEDRKETLSILFSEAVQTSFTKERAVVEAEREEAIAKPSTQRRIKKLRDLQERLKLEVTFLGSKDAMPFIESITQLLKDA